MKLIQRVDNLMGLFGLQPKAATKNSKAPALPAWWRTIGEQGAWGEGVPDAEIYKNQAERYISSPAFYAGVNRIAEAGAMAQIKVFAGPEDDAKEINPHPFLDLLKRPAPNMEWLSLDRFTLIESIMASLAITGNSYLYLGGRSAPTQAPSMLLPLRPDRLTVLPDKEVGVKGYQYLVGSQEWQIAVADIVHIRRFHPLNDFVGLSQTEPANYALATDFAAQQHNWATFKNSARLSVVIESDAQHIDPADKEMMEQYWRDTYTGDPAKAHQVAFLWGGFQAKDFGQNMRDAEYIQGRKLNRSDILMTLGIHPGLLMAEDVNLANAKTAEYLFAKYTLLPLVSRIIFRLNAEILPLYGEGQEVRAIDVVPRDEIYNAQVAATQAGAAKTLIDALGAKEGVAEAKRQKLLSAEVPEPKDEPPPAPAAPEPKPPVPPEEKPEATKPPEEPKPEPPKFNPYHDELGRFGSGGGMALAPDRGAGTRGYNAGGGVKPPSPHPPDQDVSDFLDGSGPQYSYHVTMLDNVESIADDGLIPAYKPAPGQSWQAEHSPYATYFHGDKGVALEMMRQTDDGEGNSIAAIIEFKIPRTPANARKLLPDEDTGLGKNDGLREYLDGGNCAVIGGAPREWITSIILPRNADLALYRALEMSGIKARSEDGKRRGLKSLADDDAPTEAVDLAAVAEQFARAAEALTAAKFNPYHDDMGRFAEAGTGTASGAQDEAIGGAAAAASNTDVYGRYSGDAYYRELCRTNGFDAKPRTASAAEIDKLVADGGTELHRGFRSAEFTEQFINGEHHGSNGIFGAGVYFGHGAEGATKAALYAVGGQVRAVLPKGARVGRWEDLKRQMDAELDARHDELWQRGRQLRRSEDDQAYERHRGVMRLYDDVGRWATANGWDGYVANDQEFVLLNRGALVVQQ